MEAAWLLPDLSAAIYRHTAGPELSPRRQIVKPKHVGEQSEFYLQAPANYYAKFWHDNALMQSIRISLRRCGGYSPIYPLQSQYMLVAIGW